MKRTSLRIASLLLALCLLLVLLPVPHAKAAGLSLGQLQAKFPAGAYWNHVAGSGHGYSNYNDTGSCNNPDGYTWSPCYSHSVDAPWGQYDCNSFEGGMQCCGFARKLAYDAYGSYSTGWTSYYDGDANNYMWSSLKPGDVLHYGGGNADATHGHWVFVIGVSGNAITVGECNIYNGPCQIRWGNVIYKDNIYAKRVCVAPWTLDSGSGGEPASLITWTNCVATPTQTDVKLEIRANAPYSGSFGEVGITVWDDAGKEVAKTVEGADPAATTYLNIWYNLTADTGAVLKPNHAYTFQFHVYFNGVCYTSDIGTFTTQPCSAHSWDSGKVTTKPTMTKEGTKTFTCTACSETRKEKVPATGICDGGSECVMTPYGDLTATEWYHDGIHYCIEKELMNGMSAKTFEPAGLTTRAQLVTILYRAAGSPKVSSLSEPFKDVAKGDWFYNAIVWAYNNKVVTGVSADSFAPNANVTREQVATILHRYMDAPTGKGSLSSFPDASSLSGYAIDAMVWAVGEGLINGIKDGSVSNLAPTGNATRAQIATILMRYIKSL